MTKLSVGARTGLRGFQGFSCLIPELSICHLSIVHYCTIIRKNTIKSNRRNLTWISVDVMWYSVQLMWYSVEMMWFIVEVMCFSVELMWFIVEMMWSSVRM